MICKNMPFIYDLIMWSQAKNDALKNVFIQKFCNQANRHESLKARRMVK